MPAAQAATATASTATGASRAIHSFRPGRHTTIGGEAIEFSQADIEATAAAYDPKRLRAPLVKGHPKTDDPAQGWVARLRADARGLHAEPEQVAPAFAEEVRAGRYGAVSAKFYRPTDPNNPVPGVWYLRHLGFLGAQPPAVKGLEPPAFAEAGADDGEGVCFAEPLALSGWWGAQSAGLWRNLREWFLAKFGQDEADRVLPAYQVGDLERGAERVMADVMASAEAPAFAEGDATSTAAAQAAAGAADTNPNPAQQAALTQESTVTEQEAQQLREQLAQQNAELAALRADQAQRATAALQAENTAFAEQMASEMRIAAADVGMVAAIGAQLQQAGDDVAFGEGEARKPLHQLWRAFLAAQPPRSATGEQATRERAATTVVPDAEVAFAEGEVDAERQAVNLRITNYAKAHGLSYAQAANAVMRSGAR